MEAHIALLVRSIFVENLALGFFLGMCTFLAVSKRVETAIGLGLAVIAIQVITVPVNHLIYAYLLADVTLRMTEGEMLQTRYVGRLDLKEEEYLDLAERTLRGVLEREPGHAEGEGVLAVMADDHRGVVLASAIDIRKIEEVDHLAAHADGQ